MNTSSVCVMLTCIMDTVHVVWSLAIVGSNNSLFGRECVCGPLCVMTDLMVMKDLMEGSYALKLHYVHTYSVCTCIR